MMLIAYLHKLFISYWLYHILGPNLFANIVIALIDPMPVKAAVPANASSPIALIAIPPPSDYALPAKVRLSPIVPIDANNSIADYKFRTIKY